MSKLNNIFFDKVIEQAPSLFYKRWIYKYRLQKYYDDLINTSPSYDMMREMAAFIKIAEFSFFFHNTKSMKDGFPVTYTKDGIIYIEFDLNDTNICTIGLNQKNTNITISILNNIKNEIISSLKFKDRELSIDNKIDEYLFINMLHIMMTSFVDLMKYCKTILEK